MIIAGKAKPSFVVSHEVGIDDAEVAYEKFDKRSKPMPVVAVV